MRESQGFAASAGVRWPLIGRRGELTGVEGARASPVTVLITMRSETQAPDPIVALWKDAVAERFEVQPLSRDEVAALVAAVLGGQVDGSTVHTLWRLAQGNPLYLRELVLGGLDSGSLACAAGVWRVGGGKVTSPP